MTDIRQPGASSGAGSGDQPATGGTAGTNQRFSAERTEETTTGGTPGSVEAGRYQMGGEPEPTGWVGWVYFAGVMMVILGSFQIIEGIVAAFRNAYYLVPSSDLVVSVNYTAWGWVHIGIGAVALAAGLGVLVGQTWARVVGIVMAVASAIINLAFIPAYPVWATIVIAIDVVVIYALAAHGREARTGVL